MIRFSDIIATPDSNILLAGTSASGISRDRSKANRTAMVNGVATNTGDYSIIKINNSGTNIWNNAFGGGGKGQEYLTSVVSTTDGQFLLLFNSNSDKGYEKTSDALIDYEGPSLSVDTWVVKTNSLGNLEWEKMYGGRGDDYAKKIFQAPDGTYILFVLSNSPKSGKEWSLSYLSLENGLSFEDKILGLMGF